MSYACHSKALPRLKIRPDFGSTRGVFREGGYGVNFQGKAYKWNKIEETKKTCREKLQKSAKNVEKLQKYKCM